VPDLEVRAAHGRGQPGPAGQLAGVIGALPLVAAALLRRLRLAAATLLKVWLEAVAKMVVQRDRPAETLPDVILRGQSAAHGLSCSSGHAMVIFAITALAAGSGLFIGSTLNLVFGVPSASTAGASG
jgi:hypothetical protein